jgi:hypothetical protein
MEQKELTQIEKSEKQKDVSFLKSYHSGDHKSSGFAHTVGSSIGC